MLVALGIFFGFNFCPHSIIPVSGDDRIRGIVSGVSPWENITLLTNWKEVRDHQLFTWGWESMSRLQEHILPSVETLIRLWAFCVPTTFTQYTGCCENNMGMCMVIRFKLLLIMLRSNHRVHTKHCNHFSRTFQGPPTRNIISQILQKCTFPVYFNKSTLCK